MSLKEFLENRTDERTVEYPFLLENLKESKSILDVGCLESPLDVWLAKNGYFVVGIDIRKPFHETVNFVRADVRFLPFRENVFDVAIAISTLEHIGLICYGLERWKGYKVDLKGDRKALDEMARVSKIMVITLPYGEGSFYWQRVYNKETLARLLEGYEVKVREYYRKKGDIWIPCLAEDCPPSIGEVKGVVCLVVEELETMVERT